MPTKKDTAKKKTIGEKKPRKHHDGMFKPGNTIGMETRVKPGQMLASVYDESYPDKIYEYCETEGVLHSFERWCLMNRVPVSTANEWLAKPEKYPQFVSACAYLKTVQKCELIENGLTDTYNAQIVKFLLTNNHGMKERGETEIKGSGGLTINIHEVSDGNT